MKYGFTGKTRTFNGSEIRQIFALADFGDVRKGDVGGWIEYPDNLAQWGKCWVYPYAVACGASEVLGDARVCSLSVVQDSLVRGDALLASGTIVRNYSHIEGDAVLTACLVDGRTVVGGSYHKEDIVF